METQLLTGGLVFAADELEKRRRQRQKKVREEKRRERRIEMEENKKQGKCKWSGEHLPVQSGCFRLTDPPTDQLPSLPQFLKSTSDWRTCSSFRPLALRRVTAAPPHSPSSCWPPRPHREAPHHLVCAPPPHIHMLSPSFVELLQLRSPPHPPESKMATSPLRPCSFQLSFSLSSADTENVFDFCINGPIEYEL